MSKQEAPTYTVKGIKTFRGMEGEGYTATLYRDGKAVALAVDDASGGPLQVEWRGERGQRTMVVVDMGYGQKREKPMTQEEKRLHDHCVTLPDLVSNIKGQDGKPIVMKMTTELFIEELVNDVLLVKDVKRILRGKVAYIDKGKLFSGKVAARNEARVIADIMREHPGATVLNGRDDEALLAAIKAMPR